ncbi:hypothetical protein [Ilumatobacter sp.]|uniref:hypothetical protein n=1 Tax=Ilumatobacter sp. TaxID=1967498 RepID=UPI003B51F71E
MTGRHDGSTETAGSDRRVRPSSRPDPDRRRFRRWFAAAVVASWLFRVAYVLVLKWGETPVGDQIYYSAQAITIMRGGGYSSPFPPGGFAADHAPLTAAVLAPFSWWSGPRGVLVQRLVMATAGAAVVAGTGLLARRLLDRRTALVATVLAGSHGAFWLNDVVIMSETFAAGAVVALLLAVHALIERPSLATAAAMGIATGVAGLVRAELVAYGAVLAIVATVLAARTSRERVEREPAPRRGGSPSGVGDRLGGSRGARPWIRLVVAGACAVAVLAPWVVRNQVRFAETTLISTQDGQTLVGANCARTYSGLGKGSWDLRCAEEVEVPEGLDQSRRSRILRAEAFAFVGDHLDEVPGVVAARLGLGLGVWRVEQMVDLNTGEGRGRWGSRIAAAQWWAVAALAAVGLRRWSSSAPRWPILVVAAMTVLTIAAVYGLPRFRIPMEIGAVVAASVAVTTGIDRLRARRERGRAAGRG